MDILFKTDNLRVIEEDWLTPNTYDVNFADPPNKPGVYFLLAYQYVNYNLKRMGIVYVGSSQDLRIRYNRHEVKRCLSFMYDYVRFYFKEDGHYKEKEKELIREIKPQFNIQYNR